MPKMTMLNRLKKILQAMYAGNRRPLRIYLSYAKLTALQSELRAAGLPDIHPGNMRFMTIPIELSPVGTGLWVSCITENETGEKR